MSPQLHHDATKVLHGRLAHTVRHSQRSESQLQHDSVSSAIFFVIILTKHRICVEQLLYSCCCVVGSPGWTIRTKTWTSLFLYSASTVTMTTLLGWVTLTVDTKTLHPGDSFKYVCSLASVQFTHPPTLNFHLVWRIVCPGSAQCLWLSQSFWALPFSREDWD